MRRLRAVRMGSQLHEFASRSRVDRIQARPHSRRKSESVLPEISFGVVLVHAIACALPTPLSAQSSTKTAALPQSALPQVEKAANRVGTLQLPTNLPQIDSLVAAKDDPFFPSRART